MRGGGEELGKSGGMMHVDTATAHMHVGNTTELTTSMVCQALCEFQG